MDYDDFLKLASLILIAGFVLCFATPSNAEPTITIPLEQFRLIEKALQQNDLTLRTEHAERQYWFDQYRNLKNCVRDAETKGNSALGCIGDTES